MSGVNEIRSTFLDYFAKHGPAFDEEIQALYDAGVRPNALE